jgi:hypothetical protein
LLHATSRRDILSSQQITIRCVALYPSMQERAVAAMPIIENTPRRLVLKSGSTTLTLDKDAGKASLQRKMLMWSLKPVEAPLSDVTDTTVDAALDRASGVEICHTMIITRAGAGWALPAADKNEAQTNAAAIRAFLGL